MESEIHVVDFLGHERGLIIRAIEKINAMAIDTVEMKLYFEDNNRISRAYIDGTDMETIVKNTDVQRMALDWIERRIFWTEKRTQRICVANLDGTEKRVLTKTRKDPYGIDVDPTSE